MKDDVKPCPFCGATPIAPNDENIKRWPWNAGYLQHPRVEECPLDCNEYTPEEWNRRSSIPVSSLEAVIAQLRSEARLASDAMNALCGGKGYSEQGATKSEIADRLSQLVEKEGKT